MADSEGASFGDEPTLQRIDGGRKQDLDTNLNFDIRDIPAGNAAADFIKEFSLPTRQTSGGRVDGGISSPLASPEDMMRELQISDPSMRQALVAEGLAPAGISSMCRQYKMASDIFGTGMDRSWNSDSPKTSEEPEPTSPIQRSVQQQQTMARNRNEPASFKITEHQGGSNEPGSPTADIDSNSSSATRKARESSGNPLTGQGYTGAANKTAKRYYEGSNANQKLW